MALIIKGLSQNDPKVFFTQAIKIASLVALISLLISLFGQAVEQSYSTQIELNGNSGNQVIVDTAETNSDVFAANLHRMDTQYDTGEILGQIEMPAESGRSVFWHNTELFTQWASQPTEPQGIESGKEDKFYDSWPTPAQVKILKNRLFNWRDLIDHAKQD